jgi:hypothetical protein
MDTVDSQFEDGDPTFFGHRKGHGTDKNLSWKMEGPCDVHFNLTNQF